MKISELSARSGIPLATIKFYLREGLLPAGTATGPNQARYDESHLERLALIRTLKDVGGLSIAAIRKVMDLAEQPGGSVWQAIGAAVDALSERPEPVSGDATRMRTDAEVEGFLKARGWVTRPASPARGMLVDALVALRQVLNPDMAVEVLDRYADAMEAIAQYEIAHVAADLQGKPAEALQAVIAGTVLFEPVIISLRRLAEEHYAGRLLEG